MMIALKKKYFVSNEESTFNPTIHTESDLLTLPCVELISCMSAASPCFCSSGQRGTEILPMVLISLCSDYETSK